MSYLQNLELSWSDWAELETDLSPTVYYLQNDLQYVPFFVTLNANTPKEAEALYYVGVNRDPSASGPNASLSSGVKASKQIGDIVYTANAYGTGANSITIQYVSDASAVGQEYVTVAGLAITVHIITGQSTAQQVQAAVNGWNAYTGLTSYNSSASSALVSAVVDAGKAGIAQTTVGATNLANGTVALTILADFEANYKSSATLIGSFADGVADVIS